MNINIRISGAAGLGINSLADIIGNIGTRLGYKILSELEYESRIKGGTNNFDINFCNSSQFISKKIDILIALDQKAIQKNISFLKSSSIIIANSKNTGILEKSDFKILELDIQQKFENTYLLGILVKYLSIKKDYVFEQIEKSFAKKGKILIEKNKKIISEIYETYKLENQTKTIDTKNNNDFLYGNEVISKGAIDGGLEFFSGYPMTPASSILTEIINSKKITFLQPEDELAVINSALGASFTGARSMTATSGGGFALMTEAISFAIQAEIPITIVLSQRAGPSTGTPTYTESGDINFALTPSFGDFEHIVLSPSSLEEGYLFGALALNLADKYQSVVIILTDKQFSEGHSTIDTNSLDKPQINRGKIQTNVEDYKRYELTTDGISPRLEVGTIDGDFISTSYEHDEYGATSENKKNKELMTEKRFKKLQNFYELENISGFEIINPDAKKMLVTMSFNSYTAKHFVKNNPKYGLIIIKFLKPLDKRLKDTLSNKKEVTFVENNYSGQLENYITKELNLQSIETLKISHLRKYNLEPFYIEDYEDTFK